MKFNYQARNKKGETQTGVIEASSRDAAAQLLSRHDLYVTLLDEERAAPVYSRRLAFLDRVAVRDIMLFSRQLSIMFQSRVSLVEALQVLGSQMKNANFKEKIFEISESVEGGTAFSQAIEKYPSIFSLFYVNMVKSGEASGTLSGVLDYLADHLEREYYLASKIKGALVYPMFIVFLAVAVLFLMMYFVIPNLSRVLESTGAELPGITKMVLWLAGFTRAWGWLLFLFSGVAAFMVFRYSKTKEGKRFFSILSLQTPALKQFLSMVYLSRFAENLSTLIAGGLPIVQCLDITANIIGNDVYKDIIEEAREEVKKGSRISQVLQKYPSKFPPVFTQMVFVGEKSGTLDKSLMSIVRFYQKEVEGAVERLLSVLEPALIVVLGLLVGGMMAAVMLPLYNMASF
ncbi:MAG: type II secretion system F family protein [bacterium]|nr:type II secretion system F family protein [bacterium]